MVERLDVLREMYFAIMFDRTSGGNEIAHTHTRARANTIVNCLDRRTGPVMIASPKGGGRATRAPGGAALTRARFSRQA